ncbi:MAG TPA: MFS transporter [Bacillales bacterium]|nr:MFS transporter [Bacillales bacterium]
MKSLEGQAFPPLKRNYPVFRFIGGNVVSFFGDQIYLIALPLIVLALTGSALSMGTVAALERLPILLQPAAGILADRFDRKWLLLLCDIGRCLVVGVTGVIFIAGGLVMWQVYTAAFLVGLMSQIYNASQFASVPQLVRKDDLQAVNAVNSGLAQTAVLLGPGLGGLIISFYNPGYALLINSFSFLVSFLSIASISIKKTTLPERRSQTFFADLTEGFQFVLHTKPILYTNLAILLSMFGTTLFLTLMIFHLKDTIHLTAQQIGWLISFGGVGSIFGALSTNFFVKLFSYRRLLFTASVLGGLSIVLFSYAHSFAALMVFNAMGTLMASMMSPCIVTIRQTLTPDHLLGRVQATSRFMAWVLLPVSAFLAGVLAEVFGTSATILLGGVISVVASAFYLHPSLKRKMVKWEEKEGA